MGAGNAGWLDELARGVVGLTTFGLLFAGARLRWMRTDDEAGAHDNGMD